LNEAIPQSGSIKANRGLMLLEQIYSARSPR